MPRLSKLGAAALAAFGWTGLSSVSASYLVVAGGGGGGRLRGGGGGAGGLRTGTLSLNPALSYTVTVGAGGAGSTVATAKGSSGSDSIFSTITSTGGGGGGSPGSGNAAIQVGSNGGSGGGGATDNVTGTVSGAGGSGNTPSTSPSQGSNGGSSTATTQYGAGGGGGASAAGSNGLTSGGAAGGAGTASSITGSSVTYAGGGGGGAQSGSAGAGGAGGGGNGGVGSAGGSNGTANLGGGGGGDGNAGVVGGSGGSGIVIISYAGAQQFGGGVVTSVGGNTIHTFTTSGTLSPITPLSASYLIVAGGGAGARHSGAGAGGGGAGGLLSGSGLAIDSNSTYLVTVGAGGTIAADFAAGGDGTNSTFSMVTTSAVGGGGGGAQNSNGRSGGSGGGGTYQNGTGGAGTSGQGNNGGSVPATSGGGGGGGAGAVGSNSSGSNGGNGGNGTASSITGSSVTYAGGGGGGTNGATPGSGGTGGGGTGANASGGNATAGTANLGGGGGGAGYLGGTAGNGGSGVVIISYPGSTQQMAGGTVTITGGNVIHTFTSSGYLAPLKLVNNSLRFRSSANANLTRTPASASNRKTWTWSAWVKRGLLTSGEQVLFSAGSSYTTQTYFTFYIGSDNKLVTSTGSAEIWRTTQVFRDPAAWYHILLVVDTTQATADNRTRLYVNGTEVTSFTRGTNLSLNTDYGINYNIIHYIGRDFFQPIYFDGYLTEVNFIDGQALTPNSFGTINSYGVWQPITYGGSYGTNGFYLPFKTNASSYVGSFNGSNQYLSIASNSVFNQSGDFTIEYYAYLNANTNYQVIVGRGTGFITIQHSSDANAMIRLVRYGQATIATGGNVTAGKWNHFAIVRSGSTVTGYLNGIAVVSGTDSTSTATGNALAIGQNSDGTNYFAGQISNVRYTNTAVYTSNFTPSTSALTAVSGTQLLTLQNSSIVDNSTNALSITNNNSVTTGQTYPFAYTIFNDQGPAGNNWTPTNVSGAFGSTLDYMTDVPTLTSATAANYAVLNPLDKNTNIALSEGNLTAIPSSTADYWLARATMAFPTTGKWYWELTLNNTPYLYQAGIYSYNRPNSGSISATGNEYQVAWGTAFTYIQFQSNNAAFAAWGTNTNPTSGNVLMFAYDADNATMWIGRNGTWYNTSGTANPATNTDPRFSSIPSGLFAGVNLPNPASGGVSMNFGQRPFSYTPPTGFVALNTFNL